jgi:hypothetical protein
LKQAHAGQYVIGQPVKRCELAEGVKQPKNANAKKVPQLASEDRTRSDSIEQQEHRRQSADVNESFCAVAGSPVCRGVGITKEIMHQQSDNGQRVHGMLNSGFV